MKYSLGISKFLEGVSSLSQSIVFFYFFSLIPEEGFLISPCSALELCIQTAFSPSVSNVFGFHAKSEVSGATGNFPEEEHLVESLPHVQFSAGCGSL